jgi:hypothetical protein
MQDRSAQPRLRRSLVKAGAGRPRGIQWARRTALASPKLCHGTTRRSRGRTEGVDRSIARAAPSRVIRRHKDATSLFLCDPRIPSRPTQSAERPLQHPGDHARHSAAERVCGGRADRCVGLIECMSTRGAAERCRWASQQEKTRWSCSSRRAHGLPPSRPRGQRSGIRTGGCGLRPGGVAAPRRRRLLSRVARPHTTRTRPAGEAPQPPYV